MVASEAKDNRDDHNNNNNKKYEIDEHNYLLIRLLVTDLNDHQPRFNETKYAFFINESTEYRLHYAKNAAATALPSRLAPQKRPPLNDNNDYDDDNADDDDDADDQEDTTANYYALLLNETCARLRSSIRVHADDLDEPGVNSLVNYKISHHKHLRNRNVVAKTSASSSGKIQFMNTEDQRLQDASEMGSLDDSAAAAAAAFYIDEQSGAVSLLVCKQIVEGKFNLVNLN